MWHESIGGQHHDWCNYSPYPGRYYYLHCQIRLILCFYCFLDLPKWQTKFVIMHAINRDWDGNFCFTTTKLFSAVAQSADPITCSSFDDITSHKGTKMRGGSIFQSVNIPVHEKSSDVIIIRSLVHVKNETKNAVGGVDIRYKETMVL